MSTIPDAFDIAVIVTGDKDFMPALEKTRMRAKRVAICSVRSSCNKDLINRESRIRDFDVIWLDEYVDDLVFPMLTLSSGYSFHFYQIFSSVS